MRKTPFAILFFVVVGLALATGQALAQETTSTIRGTVEDQQGARVPGATVTITSSQGSRSVTSDAEGRFRAPFLTPGIHTVRAELAGFKVAEIGEIDLRVGQTLDLTLRLEVGAQTEVVQVVGTPPLIDVTTTTLGGTLDSEVLARIPVGRRITDTLYLLPGVSSSGLVGAANPSIGGGTGLENRYIVDGVSITNTGYGGVGSYSIVFGSLGTGLPYDWMKEIQVKSGGFEAEFGQTTGGVVNVITKSGTNIHSGTAYTYFRPKTLEGFWKQMSQVNGKVNTTAFQTNDVGVQLGGPVVRDRIFFIVGVNPLWETRRFVAPEGFPLRSLGEQNRKRRIVNYSAKGTFQLSNNHRLDASFYGDPAHGEMGPQRSTELRKTNTAGFSEIDYGGHQQVVKWDGMFGPHWLAEASFGRSYNNIEETPSVNTWSVRDRTVTPNVFSGGIGFYEVGNTGENRQYRAKSTHMLVGGHELRYGLLYEDIRYDNIIQRTGPPVTLHDGRRTVTGVNVEILSDPVFGRVYRGVRGNLGNVRKTEQQYVSFFVQDAWQVNSRLTVKPGIRYEQQKLVGNLAQFTWNGNWAPRIGATYDPTGQGRSKVFGNWGRFYAQIPNDLAARALSRDEGITRADFYDAGLTQPIPNGVLAAGTTSHLAYAGLEPSVIDPKSKSTYLDEAVLGVEYELARNLSASVRYINRRMPRVLEDIGTAPMIAYFTGQLESVEYFITNPNPKTPVTDDPTGLVSFEKPIHHYDAVEVSLDKRLSDKWSLVGSYRWSRLYGNFEGFFRNDNGQSDPAITSLFDFPTNDPTYTSIGVPQFGFRGDIRHLGKLGAGPLPTDRPHQIKLSGNYILDMGLNLGAALQFGSGRPLTPMAANPDYANAGEIPEGPRGSGIQTVNGFKKRTPFETDFDMHADYALRFIDQRIVLFADLFNVFNVRRIRDYIQDTETTFRALHPDVGKVDEYQRPFAARLGARFNW